MKFDMHCHTKEGSTDGRVMIEEYIRRRGEWIWRHDGDRSQFL